MQSRRLAPLMAALVFALLLSYGSREVQAASARPPAEAPVGSLLSLAAAMMGGGGGGGARNDPAVAAARIAQMTELAVKRASQVVKFNLVNLVMLALGKVLLTLIKMVTSPMSLSLMFPKSWANKLYRSSAGGPDGPPRPWAVDHTELDWVVRFLSSENARNWVCLQRSFCENPLRAQRYVGVGRAIQKAVEWTRFADVFEFDMERQERIAMGLEAAIKHGLDNKDQCAAKYKCRQDFN